MAEETANPASLDAVPPSGDPVYRTVRALREPGVLEKRILDAWRQASDGPPPPMQLRQVQLHYKPYARARILARAVVRAPETGAAGAVQFFFLQTVASPEAARRRFATAVKAPRRPCYGPPVVLLDDLSTIAWALPNAPRLGPSRVCFDPKKFRKFLKANGVVKPSRKRIPELIRYVPRKRALFYGLPTGSLDRPFYLKFYAPGQDVVTERNIRSLQAARDRGDLGFAVPRLIFRCAKRRAVAMEEIPGRKFTRLLLTEPQVFRAVGEALASLHVSGLAPDASWHPDGELRALAKAMRDVRRAHPAVSDSLDGTIADIEQRRTTLTFEDSAPIHGNLFGDQILVQGDDVGLVDWDDLRRGDPTYDLGRLIAHSIFMARRKRADEARVSECIRQLLLGHGEGAGRAVDLDVLRWQTAVALLMRAKISALRVLSPGWAGEIAAAAGEARRLLDGRAGWL